MHLSEVATAHPRAWVMGQIQWSSSSSVEKLRPGALRCSTAALPLCWGGPPWPPPPGMAAMPGTLCDGLTLPCPPPPGFTPPSRGRGLLFGRALYHAQAWFSLLATSCIILISAKFCCVRMLKGGSDHLLCLGSKIKGLTKIHAEQTNC